MTEPIVILGAPGSPYSRKVRAVARYRRIPYEWAQRGSPDDVDTPKVPVELLPVVVFPADGDTPRAAAIDSTPIIRRLEVDYAGRSIVPSDPALAFIDELLEDYGDEWLTKAMFHFRWAYQADIDKAAAILPRWRMLSVPHEQIEKFSKGIARRQIDRLWVVGSNETTAEVIEQSYVRFLGIFEAHLEHAPYALGQRPGCGDFGMYGQLTQLATFDPTPMALTLAHGPRVAAWVDIVEDLSGTRVADDGWFHRDSVPDTLRELLAEIGRVYAPFLLGNAAAITSGAERVECEVDGRNWVQKPFPYQAKCLGWLRDSYRRLAADDRAAVDNLLSGTGCEALFA